MKICDEMIKLRKMLDDKGIQWEDKSTIIPETVIDEIMAKCKVERRYADTSMHRTHFTVKDTFFSVIYGYGSYGYNSGLLECMIDDNEPIGCLTANEVISRMEEL